MNSKQNSIAKLVVDSYSDEQLLELELQFASVVANLLGDCQDSPTAYAHNAGIAGGQAAMLYAILKAKRDKKYGQKNATVL